MYILPPLLPNSTSSRLNNSITDQTVRGLAAWVRHDYPELASVLVEVGQYAGLAPSSTTQGIPRIDDVIARTNHTFGSEAGSFIAP